MDRKDAGRRLPHEAPRTARTSRIASGLVLASIIAGWTPVAPAALTLSEVLIDVEGRCGLQCYQGFDIESISAVSPRTVPAGSASGNEALLEPDAWQRFSLSDSRLPAGFISAALNGQGVGGVGISGRWNTGGSAQALARYRQIVTNGGADDVALAFNYRVPMIETLFSHTENVDREARGEWWMIASIQLQATVRDAAGTIIDESLPLDLFLQVDRINRLNSTASLSTVNTNDAFLMMLGENQNVSIVNTTAGANGFDKILGFRIDAFEDEVLVGTLPAGGTAELQYEMLVAAFVNDSDGDDRTTGFQVLIGDPFDISGSSQPAFNFVVAPPVVVPAPPALFGLIAGLVCLAPIAGSRDARERARAPRG